MVAFAIEEKIKSVPWTYSANALEGRKMRNSENTKDEISRREVLLGSSAVLGAISMVPAASVYATESATTSRIFNVIDFGAIPATDVTNLSQCPDSTDAINAAILAAATTGDTTPGTSHGGGVVYIPRGTYRITAPILISNNNIQIIGDGKSVTVLYGHGVSGAMLSFNSSSYDTQIQDCSVQGLTLMGTYGPKAADYMIAMYSTARCTLRDVSFSASVTDSALLIERSWINHFYDLHFMGHCPRAHLYLHHPNISGHENNALMFFGCNFSANGTPTGILMESDRVGQSLGSVIVLHGVTCQNYSRGIWIRHAEGVNITGFYGEGSITDIHIGDDAGNAFARSVAIDSWMSNVTTNAIVLDQCRDVRIGNGCIKSVTNPIVIGEATGVTIDAGRNMADKVLFAPNKRNRTGVMIFDGDRHGPPDWPSQPTPMGIILRADSETIGRHFKITVDDAGNLQTTEVVIGNRL